MRTFSEIVDALEESLVAMRSKAQLAVYVQSAIAEANLDNRKAAWDTIEVEIPFSQLIKGNRFMLPADYLAGMEVDYDRSGIPVPQRKLGSVKPDTARYWYQAERYLVFSGNIRENVQLAYQRLTPVMQYYPADKRLLRSSANPGEVFQYRPDTDAEWVSFNPLDPMHMSSYYRHSSWLIERWGSILLTGAKSYLFKETGQLNEGGRLYSNFTAQLARLKNAE